ncbi:MAG: YidB family protein [Pseudomonadota bacterium]
MGLLDGVIGNVLNNLGNEAGNPAGGNAMLQIVTGLIQQNGGLPGLLDKFGQAGLGQQVASWISQGDNQSINADQLSQALGSGPLADLAQRFGLDPQALSSNLAQQLPEVVNQLTPEGRLPDNANNSDLLEQGLAALAGKLFR